MRDLTFHFCLVGCRQYFSCFDAARKLGCGESIKEFLALGFRVRFYGGSVFVTSNDLINRRYKTDAKNRCYLFIALKPKGLPFLSLYSRFARLHRFSRLPLKKPIAVPKQKPRACNQALCFLFFDRLHAPEKQLKVNQVVRPSLHLKTFRFRFRCRC